MRKKKQAEIFKKGMEAGAKPFEEKYDKVAEEINRTSSHMDEIARGQKKQSKIVNQAIEGGRENRDNIDKIEKDAKQEKKVARKYRRKTDEMALMMKTTAVSCDKCGKPITPYQLVCSCCGELSAAFPYELSGFDIKDKCYERVGGLSEAIREADSREDDWLYEELDDKFIKMKKIKEIAYRAMKDAGEGNSTAYRKIYELANKFFADYKKRRIEIAVVGTVKAGKSSLINSLIGTELASVDATPETSILVKYRTTKDKNYLRISFYTEKQWGDLWKTTETATVFRNEYKRLDADTIKYEYLGKRTITINCTEEELPEIMMEWSMSDSPKHFFVKEIEVGYQSDTIPHDIFLVDTPGLSDPVKYRSNITRDYIKKSDWILACIVSENLSGQPEFNFLSKVIANKGGDVSKIFVVATKKDSLTDTELKKKSDEFLVRLGELYKNNEMAQSRFSSVAAEMHLLTQHVIRGKQLSDDERKKLRKAIAEFDFDYSEIVDNEEQIVKYAGVKKLFDRIESIVINNRRNLIVSRIEEDYQKCMKVINDNASSYLDESKAFLKTLTENREIEQEQIDEIEQSNKELEILQGRVRELKRKLDIEISINSDAKRGC